MQGLTAKVFRTYNASWTMAKLLREMKSTGSIVEKVKDYNDANRKVAILCNHKRTVAAGHAGQIEKMEEKVCHVCDEYLSNANINLDQRPPISTMACEADDARH